MPTAIHNMTHPETHPSPGRSCPLHYRYGAASLARPAEADCETLYVVGGLYGNDVSLDSVLTLFDAEPGPKRLVFNGDFHWFDRDPAVFAAVQRRVLAFDALRGNVETELADASATGDAGCGCAYPAWVGDGVVERSNRILAGLRGGLNLSPDGVALRAQLAALDMTRRVDVAGVRVGIVHGDADSLAGWGFAAEHLADSGLGEADPGAVDPGAADLGEADIGGAGHRAQARAWFDMAQVDLFACSHTCLPVFHSLPMAGRRFTPAVLNNGAAGMPNFRADSSGLLTRISVHAVLPAHAAQRRHGLQRGGVHIDALAVDIPADQWHPRFLAQWPAGSDGHASYWARICAGPDHAPEDALRSDFD